MRSIRCGNPYFPFNFPPTGWAFWTAVACRSQNTALSLAWGRSAAATARAPSRCPTCRASATDATGQGQGCRSVPRRNERGRVDRAAHFGDADPHSHAASFLEAADTSYPTPACAPVTEGLAYTTGSQPLTQMAFRACLTGGGPTHNNMRPTDRSILLALQGIFRRALKQRTSTTFVTASCGKESRVADNTSTNTEDEANAEGTGESGANSEANGADVAGADAPAMDAAPPPGSVPVTVMGNLTSVSAAIRIGTQWVRPTNPPPASTWFVVIDLTFLQVVANVVSTSKDQVPPALGPYVGNPGFLLIVDSIQWRWDSVPQGALYSLRVQVRVWSRPCEQFTHNGRVNLGHHG